MTSRPSDHSDSSFFCLPSLMMCQHHATYQPARYDLSGSAMLLVRQRTRRYFVFIDCRNQPSEWLKNNYIRLEENFFPGENFAAYVCNFDQTKLVDHQ